MHRILDDKSAGGLALRRCQWYTNSKHVKSQAAAKRLGFIHEGILRAHRVLLPGREGARREFKNGRRQAELWADCSWEERGERGLSFERYLGRIGILGRMGEWGEGSHRRPHGSQAIALMV